jgi:predicted MFS family arabinose efflux permease
MARTPSVVRGALYQENVRPHRFGVVSALFRGLTTCAGRPAGRRAKVDPVGNGVSAQLPVGAIALVVIAVVLPAMGTKQQHKIDYLGATTLAAFATALVLATSWGGTTYAWSSPVIISLFAGSALMLAAWYFSARTAAEPVLPLRLFKNSVFSVAAAIGLAAGFAMFGALSYLPLFLQVVHGVSPTISGVYLLPMVLGLLITSIGSGQIIARTGRYKVFPIVGTAVMAVALYLLSMLDETTPTRVMNLYFFILGFSLCRTRSATPTSVPPPPARRSSARSAGRSACRCSAPSSLTSSRGS